MSLTFSSGDDNKVLYWAHKIGLVIENKCGYANISIYTSSARIGRRRGSPCAVLYPYLGMDLPHLPSQPAFNYLAWYNTRSATLSVRRNNQQSRQLKQGRIECVRIKCRQEILEQPTHSLSDKLATITGSQLSQPRLCLSRPAHIWPAALFAIHLLRLRAYR